MGAPTTLTSLYFRVIQGQGLAKLYFYACVCVYVYVLCGLWVVHAWDTFPSVCACVHSSHTQGGQNSLLGVFHYCSFLYFLQTGSWGLSMIQSPALSAKLLSQKVLGLCPPTLGLESHTTISRFLYECWKFELRPLCPLLKLSYLLSCLPSPLNDTLWYYTYNPDSQSIWWQDYMVQYAYTSILYFELLSHFELNRTIHQ